MLSDKPHLELCNLTFAQYPQIKHMMDEAYPELGGAWPEHTIQRLIEEFPEGQIGVVDGDELVGIALSLQVDGIAFGVVEHVVVAVDDVFVGVRVREFKVVDLQ